jgi:hypothetical protein
LDIFLNISINTKQVNNNKNDVYDFILGFWISSAFDNTIAAADAIVRHCDILNAFAVNGADVTFEIN